MYIYYDSKVISIRTAASGRADAPVLPAGTDHVSGGRSQEARGSSGRKGGKIFFVCIIQQCRRAHAETGGVSPRWRKDMTKHLHNLCMLHHGVGD